MIVYNADDHLRGVGLHKSFYQLPAAASQMTFGIIAIVSDENLRPSSNGFSSVAFTGVGFILFARGSCDWDWRWKKLRITN